MALQLSYTVQPGLTGNHWEVTDQLISRFIPAYTIRVHLWVDGTQALAGEPTIFSRAYTFAKDDYIFVAQELNEAGASIVKSLEFFEQYLIDNFPEWSGAVRVSNQWQY